MAYFLFTKLILSGQTIKVFNNGNMNRDFTYIDDIVEGVVRVIDNPPSKEKKVSSLSKAPYKIYNIGNNSPINLLRFIEIIEEKLGIVGKKQMLPMQPGDVYTTYADASALMKDFDYQPGTNLSDGLEVFVKWYQKYYSN